MNKLTKGALSMVLAGSVTFSIANALLAEQPLKRLAKEIALPISADRKKADVVNQVEKKVKVQTPTTNVKNHDIAAIPVSFKNSNMAKAAIQTDREKSSNRTTTTPANTNETTTPTHTIPVTSAKAPTTTSKSTSTRTDTTSPTTRPVAITKPVATTKPTSTTKPATSVKAPPTTTSTKPKSVTTRKTNTAATKTNTKNASTTKTNTKSATTTNTNRGQQVSQAAKERAANRKATNENTGKKM
ncbi:hypothetical protein [Neobacillus drentensis]|uniref:hypothetical protein n=1 Tax=Neobacillus drentensis TaxID=220684 RepID=UPI003002BEFE